MVKEKSEQNKSLRNAAKNVAETIRNTQAQPTEEFGKKLKTDKKRLDPLNGPKEYH